MWITNKLEGALPLAAFAKGGAFFRRILPGHVRVPYPWLVLPRVGIFPRFRIVHSDSNLHGPFFPIQIVSKATPRPVLRHVHQSAFYRITVHVSQLLDQLAPTPNIEIVVPTLPEMRVIETELPGDRLLQRLDQRRKRPALRFAQQQMDVFRHNDVSVHARLVTSADDLQLLLQNAPGLGCAQPWLAPVTTESDEVKLSRLVEAAKAPRHAGETTADDEKHKGPKYPTLGKTGQG